ncbi:hypothetical protein D3C81_1929260 [compost metagenome]
MDAAQAGHGGRQMFDYANIEHTLSVTRLVQGDLVARACLVDQDIEPVHGSLPSALRPDQETHHCRKTVVAKHSEMSESAGEQFPL